MTESCRAAAATAPATTRTTTTTATTATGHSHHHHTIIVVVILTSILTAAPASIIICNTRAMGMCDSIRNSSTITVTVAISIIIATAMTCYLGIIIIIVIIIISMSRIMPSAPVQRIALTDASQTFLCGETERSSSSSSSSSSSFLAPSQPRTCCTRCWSSATDCRSALAAGLRVVISELELCGFFSGLGNSGLQRLRALQL